jgi:hypothetical protein
MMSHLTSLGYPLIMSHNSVLDTGMVLGIDGASFVIPARGCRAH